MNVTTNITIRTENRHTLTLEQVARDGASQTVVKVDGKLVDADTADHWLGRYFEPLPVSADQLAAVNIVVEALTHIASRE